jgi:CRP-like cAMP-binding protein
MPQLIDPTILRQAPLFRTLDKAQLRQVGALLQERRYCGGDIIFRQGDPGGCLYLVGAGRARTYLHTPDGREVTLHTYAGGGIFGELSVLDGRPRSSNAAAMDDLTTFVLFREDLFASLRADFGIVERLIDTLVDRLRYATNDGRRPAFVSAPGRVAATLVELAGERPPAGPVQVAVTQQELAQLANTGREWVSRALREFADQGLVRLDRGAVVVLDRIGLQQRVE